MTSPQTEAVQQARILVVDDDKNLRLIITDRLRAQGHDVDTADCLAAALDRLENNSYQLVCLDVYLPDQQNLEGLRQIRQLQPGLPIIVMTAHGTIDLAVEAMKEGAYDFITKPFNFKRLQVLVQRVLESNELRTEVDYLRRTVDGQFSHIIGENSGLGPVMELVRRVAPTESTVLLRGETGTGKEVIARAIHRLSSRRRKPFVVANCAAIPRELMESEMFGHVRGAFTGAVANHAGYFETAGGGTLLLDEIGDLDQGLQSKILRVLEEGSYRKVGSPAVQQNRARIIASTHQPLEELMTAGRFREDLFYRLNVLPVDLPALRDRTQDIPDLAHHFLGRACESRTGGAPHLAPEALTVLERHPWHGNLRELRNCMERIAIVVCGQTVAAADVLPLLHDRVQPQSAATAGLELKDVERQTILAALEQHGGNRTHAAAALGIGRRTLQIKLKQYGLAADEAAGDD